MKVRGAVPLGTKSPAALCYVMLSIRRAPVSRLKEAPSHTIKLLWPPIKITKGKVWPKPADFSQVAAAVCGVDQDG